MSPRAREQRRSDYLVGIALLLLVVVLWTGSNFLTQSLYDSFPKPFLVTYLNTASFAFYLVPYLLFSRKRLSYQPLESTTDDHTTTSTTPLSHKETRQLALAFCALWFFANWSVNASLQYTTVASSTILASTSGIFTLILGHVLQLETVDVIKGSCVSFSFFGVSLVANADSQTPLPGSGDPSRIPRHPLLGDFLALVSAFFYATYVSLLKKRIAHESRIDMQLFFGYVGLFNIILSWPFIPILSWSGVEPFALPSSKKEWFGVLVNMLITFVSDYAYVIAMLRTTPLVATLGLSLTIPLAILGDLILGTAMKLQVILGGLLVITSFVVIGIPRDENESPPQNEGSIDINH